MYVTQKRRIKNRVNEISTKQLQRIRPDTVTDDPNHHLPMSVVMSKYQLGKASILLFGEAYLILFLSPLGDNLPISSRLNGLS